VVGDRAGAIDACECAARVAPSPLILASLAFVYRTAGRIDDADRVEHELAARPQVSPDLLALIRVGHGDTGGALRYLELAHEARAAGRSPPNAS
jgi:hypothetical protein